jgi:hypothetical protein
MGWLKPRSESRQRSASYSQTKADPDDLEKGLQRYEVERKPIVQKIVTAAKTSADWYAGFEEHMKLPPIEFGYSYITRSGRVDDDRLRRGAPNFMSSYDAHIENRNPGQHHARAN